MKSIKKTVCFFLMACMIFGLSGQAVSGNIASGAVKTRVKLNKKRLSLKTGEKYTLKAKVKPAKKVRFSWKSNKKKVAKVTKKGTVKAIGEGRAIVTVRVKKTKLKAKCKVTVNNGDVSSDNLTQAENNGTKTDIVPTASPDKTSTSKPDTKETPDVQSTATPSPEPTAVFYDNPAKKIEFSDKDYVTLEVGKTYSLNTKLSPSDAQSESVGYESVRDYIASVDDKGNIKAEYPGMTVIKASSKMDPSVSAQIHINVVDTSQPPDGFDTFNSRIAHGKIVDINYTSDYRSNPNAHALAWLPPTYDKNEKKYNILFCLHGGYDNEYNWTQAEAGDKVLDCLYAEGKMEETIVVFTSGVINWDNSRNYPNLPANRTISDWGRDHYLLEFEIINNLLPYMLKNYPIMEGDEHTAVCGLSMGGGQTLDIGLNNPDVFDYVGCFSAGPFLSGNQKFVNSEKDAEELNKKLRFFSIMVGTEDHMGDDNVRVFERTCTKYGVNHLFVEEQGLGHEPRCWNRNLYKFMKYAFK